MLATSWQSQENGMCAQQRLRSAWASAQSDQSSLSTWRKLGSFSYPLSGQRRLWSDWEDAQADLSLRWVHSHFVGFVVRRLIYRKILLLRWNIQNMPHDKTNKMACAPSEEIGLGILPVWSVFAFRMKKAWIFSYPLSTQRRLWSDQVPRLIWVFAGHTVILLVLSWDCEFREDQLVFSHHCLSSFYLMSVQLCTE